MNRFFYASVLLSLFALTTFAQKGVDTQSRKIHEDAVRGTQITSNSGKTYDFGEDKTKTREMLANPYKLASRRDVLINNVVEVLKERKLVLDETASRLSDGFIVTQPFIFSKGAVITQNELNRYAVLPAGSNAVYSRGRYTLTVEIQSIDGIQNNVSITAKVDGKAENGLRSEWNTLQSSGIAEDEFLSKLIEMVTGTSPDAPQVK